MFESWRLLTGAPVPDGPVDTDLQAAYHMAVDEAIITTYRKAKVPPTFRLYTWHRPSLTIGYFQSIQEELDWPACLSEKIPVIRRITGGRAVLHGRDLTYSVVAGPSSLIFPTKSIQETFLTISRAFLQSLRYLGLNAEAVSSSPKHIKNPLCFASPSWHEIVCEGRKVIGSAQRRWRDAFLQQGSILIEFDPSEFYRLFQFPTEKQRTEMIRTAGEKAAGLSECSKRTLSFQEVQDALVLGFEQALGVVLKPGTLTAHEIELARHLTLKKYSQDDWNLKRVTPP